MLQANTARAAALVMSLASWMLLILKGSHVINCSWFLVTAPWAIPAAALVLAVALSSATNGGFYDWKNLIQRKSFN